MIRFLVGSQSIGGNLRRFSHALVLSRTRGLPWLMRSLWAEVPLLPAVLHRMVISKWEPRSRSFTEGLAGVHVNQLWPERRAGLRYSVNLCGKHPITAVEVGTWYALGSTPLLVENLPNGSSLTCIDNYSPTEGTEGSSAQMKLFASRAQRSAQSQVANFKLIRPEVKVSLITKKANDALAEFPDSSLDFIYLDGSHLFSDLANEIQIALKKLKKGGVLCGDDLETVPTPELMSECAPKREVDVIFLRSGKCIHPGVLCAVGQHLPGVRVDNGHWRYQT